MDRVVVIPLRGRNRVEDIIPYLDDIAQPGTKIVFMMHLGTWRFERQLEKLLAIQRAAKQSGYLPTHSTPDSAARNGELEVRRRLQNVEVELTFYRGSLRALTDRLTREPRQTLVMLRPAPNLLARWLYKVLYARLLPGPLAATPVLLCHWGGR